MAANWHTITPAARAALEQHARCDGPRVTITAQLDPDAWQQVSGVLSRLGGTYVPNASAFDLPPGTDASTAVARALTVGRVMAPAGAQGYVPTPEGLADELVSTHAELPGPVRQTLRVLEPSAGTGQFVSVLLGYPDLEVVAVEMDRHRAHQIPDDPRVTTVVDTFEAFASGAYPLGAAKYDRIVMNPPFAVPGRPQLWAEHLLLAWRLLAPGGRLLAILPASALDKRPRGDAARKAAALIAGHGFGAALAPDAFEPSGISFRTCAVWLDRLPEHAPTTAPMPARPAYLPRSYTGDETTVGVDRLFLTRSAALEMPVQRWLDPWTSRLITLVHRGNCAACDRPAWLFVDDGNDPRGAVGLASACWSLVADENGRHGPDIVLCAACGGDGATHERMVRDVAAKHWTTNPRPVPVRASAARQEPAQSSLFELAGASR